MFRAFGVQQDFVQTFCRARITEETAFSTLSKMQSPSILTVPTVSVSEQPFQ
jgi:hypothetical protein